jgi:hypothetical protein
MLNTIQTSSTKNKLVVDDSLLVSTSYLSAVIDELKSTNKDSFRKIRQIIADANIDDFDELFKTLYEKSSEYLPGKEGTVAILINDHQYKANFRIDKEINAMSLISNLINNK